MFLLALSAAFVGFVHSLAPGHWLPVVLMTKVRRWDWKQATLGAAIAASGHIVVSLSLGLVALFLDHELLEHGLHEFEEKGGWLLILFGIGYGLYSHFRHRACHGHEHHGPEPQANEKAPYVFLFTLGLSPCFAVLPVFVSALAISEPSLMLCMVTFSLGVFAAFVGGSTLVAKGLVRLDHPILEHHGDTLVGAGVAVMGVILLLLPHTHAH